jgi:uncharacterized protein (DUF58 family)
VYIFLDTSVSMEHIEPRKLDYAKRVASALAYVVLAGQTIPSYADGLREMPTRRRKNQAPQVFNFLGVSQGRTSLFAALRRYFVRARAAWWSLVSTFSI